jgi:hypothetical protein
MPAVPWKSADSAVQFDDILYRTFWEILLHSGPSIRAGFTNDAAFRRHEGSTVLPAGQRDSANPFP